LFTSEQLPELRRKIRAQAALEARVLDELVRQAVGLAPHVRPIRPRTATAVALTAADGGNNSVAFNPFELEVIRVVDSQGKELFLDVVSPATDIEELGRRHRSDRTVLGKLMDDLDAQRLSDLSGMMTTRNRRWVEVYRDLCEWATLHDLITSHQFAADTLIVRDGLLRTKIFAGDTLLRLGELMKQAIDRQAKDNRRRIWLAGLAKKSKVLDHYRLAMSLAGIFDRGTPCFVPVPHELQERVYRSNADYLREPGDDESGAESGRPGATDNRATENIGAMYFVRFGPHAGDPIWTADLLAWQRQDAQAVFGHLQADAAAGFPVPFYPFSLQQADAHSRVADLDLDIIEDGLVGAVRDHVGDGKRHIVDALLLATQNVAARRYGLCGSSTPTPSSASSAASPPAAWSSTPTWCSLTATSSSRSPCTASSFWFNWNTRTRRCLAGSRPCLPRAVWFLPSGRTTRSARCATTGPSPMSCATST
jgi:hypothetical protein